MNFWQRLTRFGIGLFLGTLLSIYFFGDRGCGGWTPSEQVKSFIVNGNLVLSDSVLAKHPDLTGDDVIRFVDHADVDFSASGTQDDPKWYVLTSSSAQQGLTEIEVVLTDTASVVRRVER